MNHYYFSLNDYFKKEFHEKIYKVSLDAGLSCPNRDGTLSNEGCIFCSDRGSGEFAGNPLSSITNQIDEQLLLINKKFPSGKVVAYFQNFTNTYADIDYLRKIYFEALLHPRVMGIAIATRPDCINNDILELLDEINKKYFLWIELGLQTSDDEVAEYINRGYKTEVFIETASKLKSINIKFVTHIIIGLPFAKENDSLNTALLAVKSGTWGIKLHLLYIIKNSKIFYEHKKINFDILSLDQYTDLVVEIIEQLPDTIVIHRLTGDGDKNTLEAPLWSTNKKNVLNTIIKKLKSKNSYQGKFFKV